MIDIKMIVLVAIIESARRGMQRAEIGKSGKNSKMRVGQIPHSTRRQAAREKIFPRHPGLFSFFCSGKCVRTVSALSHTRRMAKRYRNRMISFLSSSVAAAGRYPDATRAACLTIQSYQQNICSETPIHSILLRAGRQRTYR